MYVLRDCVLMIRVCVYLKQKINKLSTITMESCYSIVLYLKTRHYKQPYGKFGLGNDLKFSQAVFEKLNGATDPVTGCSIEMELTEEIGHLAVPIGSLHCCLAELKENVAIISKEIFKTTQLEDQDFVPLQ